MKIQELIERLQSEASITPHASVSVDVGEPELNGEVADIENNGQEVKLIVL